MWHATGREAGRAESRRMLPTSSAIAAPSSQMMAHGGIFWQATGFSVQEAHAAVLDPTNLRIIVARITPEEWGSIAWLRPQ
jgi:hypothetical protein